MKTIYTVSLKKTEYIDAYVLASDEEEAIVRALSGLTEHTLCNIIDTEVEGVKYNEDETESYYEQRYQERKEEVY